MRQASKQWSEQDIRAYPYHRAPGPVLARISGQGLSRNVWVQRQRTIDDTMTEPAESGTRTLKLCLTGDVMTGRGIDQALAHPGKPELHEDWVKDARDYIALAERSHGRISRPLSPEKLWGDALPAMERFAPDLTVINLETSITSSEEFWPGKGIHYRMHPQNIDCLTVAGVDCCVLANNHILDWGTPGLEDTLETLESGGLSHAGAGRDIRAAEAPAVFELPGTSRLLVFAAGFETSGVPSGWRAKRTTPGINLLSERSPDAARQLAEQISASRRDADIAIVSLHWGGNFGYEIPPEQRSLAHALIDCGLADVVHGHSSHHVKGIEVYRGRLVLYGCGDFINDYEGIHGHEAYRGDLALLYCVTLDASTGQLLALRMNAFRHKRFSLLAAAGTDVIWLEDLLKREGKRLGTGVVRNDDSLLLTWPRLSSHE